MKGNKAFSLFLTSLICSITLSCNKFCETRPENNISRTFFAEVPSGLETKTFLNDDIQIRWTVDDRLSIFSSATNEQYRFSGQTGREFGIFEKVGTTSPSSSYSRNYAIYPYAVNSESPSEGKFNISLPPTQYYAENSFGLGANTMAAMTKTLEDNTFKFKNICGYLLLKIYGGDIIRSIKFYGNNGEKIAGDALLNIGKGEMPSLTMADSAVDEIVLDCGEGGIATGLSEGDLTNFYIVTPETVFSKGFTVEIQTTTGYVFKQSTKKPITISTNAIKQMSAIKCDSDYGNELLSFELHDGVNVYESFSITDSLVCVSVPNGKDVSKMTPYYTYLGKEVLVGEEKQTSGINEQDFSDFSKPIVYSVISKDGRYHNYKILLFDIPVLTIETPNRQPILSKVNWIPNTKVTLRLDNNTLIDLGTANIRGRGSTSWAQPKKPYALKLDSKLEILGMKKSKRWDLISNSRDKSLLQNDVTYHIANNAEHLEWSPSGEFVELILNGKHIGNYYLCEHIKIEKNRLDLVEMDPVSDVSGEALTGAYLIEMTYYFDSKDIYTFHTDKYHFGCTLKSPDENVCSEQLGYIKGYMDMVETMLSDDDRLLSREYLDYIDVDTFIDYWLIEDLVGNFDSAKPKSTFLYKNREGSNRDSRLKAGPVWDFDVYAYSGSTKFVMKDSLYYRCLFKDPHFVSDTKRFWNGDGQLKGLKNIASPENVCNYIDGRSGYIYRSAVRDKAIWSPSENYSTSIEKMKTNYTIRYNWFDSAVNAFVVNYDTLPGGNEDVDSQDDKTDDFNFNFQ